MQCTKRGSLTPWVSQGRLHSDTDVIFERGIRVGQIDTRLQVKTLPRKQLGQRQRDKRKWGTCGEL